MPVEAIHANAVDLLKILKDKKIPRPATILNISMLHEVYSYVEKDGKKFNIESVKELLRSELSALAPGGRILVRDGVIPENGDEMQVLEIKGKNNKEVFDAFLKNFEGRDLSYIKVVGEDADNEYGKPASCERTQWSSSLN